MPNSLRMCLSKESDAFAANFRVGSVTLSSTWLEYQVSQERRPCLLEWWLRVCRCPCCSSRNCNLFSEPENISLVRELDFFLSLTLQYRRKSRYESSKDFGYILRRFYVETTWKRSSFLEAHICHICVRKKRHDAVKLNEISRIFCA